MISFCARTEAYSPEFKMNVTSLSCVQGESCGTDRQERAREGQGTVESNERDKGESTQSKKLPTNTAVRHNSS